MVADELRRQADTFIELADLEKEIARKGGYRPQEEMPRRAHPMPQQAPAPQQRQPSHPGPGSMGLENDLDDLDEDEIDYIDPEDDALAR